MKKASILILLMLVLSVTMTACSERDGITSVNTFSEDKPKAENSVKMETLSEMNMNASQIEAVKAADITRAEEGVLALSEEQSEFTDEYEVIIFNADGSVAEYVYKTDEEDSEQENEDTTSDSYLGYNELKELSREERVAYFRTIPSYDFRLFIYPDEIIPDMCFPLDERYFPNGWAFNTSKLHADEDSEVYSIAAGTVIYANEYGDFTVKGNTVVIEHENGYTSMYSGLKHIYVKTGQQVEGGEIIATLADHTIIKNDTPYLGFEIYKDEEPVTIPGDGVIGIKELYYCIDAVKKDIAAGKDNVSLNDYDNDIYTIDFKQGEF